MERMVVKNIESKKYIEKYNLVHNELFARLLLANGSDDEEVLSLIEKGIPLIVNEVEKAGIYFLAVSLLDNISQELSSFATDIMLYAEEKDNGNIPKEFSSLDDIKKVLLNIRKVAP